MLGDGGRVPVMENNQAKHNKERNDCCADLSLSFSLLGVSRVLAITSF